MADFGLQPVNETGYLPLALPGSGCQSHLTSHAVLGLEEHHLVSPLSAGTSRLKAPGSGAHHDNPFTGPV